MYRGRKLCIATKHGKEKVIAPLFERELWVDCIVPHGFDTDVFGTFTMTIERKEDALTTARNKVIAALKHSDCDLGIASEGSFGPHPSIGFFPVNEEVLFFVDLKNDLEIFVKNMSLETNFSGEKVQNISELHAFAEKAKFPTHGLIVKKDVGSFSDMVSGITDVNVLEETFANMLTAHGTAYVETDMRAMFNPTRMKVIEATTEKLLQKILNKCPSCGMPGYGITEIIAGVS